MWFYTVSQSKFHDRGYSDIIFYGINSIDIIGCYWIHKVRNHMVITLFSYPDWVLLYSKKKKKKKLYFPPDFPNQDRFDDYMKQLEVYNIHSWIYSVVGDLLDLWRLNLPFTTGSGSPSSRFTVPPETYAKINTKLKAHAILICMCLMRTRNNNLFQQRRSKINEGRFRNMLVSHLGWRVQHACQFVWALMIAPHFYTT